MLLNRGRIAARTPGFFAKQVAGFPQMGSFSESKHDGFCFPGSPWGISRPSASAVSLRSEERQLPCLSLRVSLFSPAGRVDAHARRRAEWLVPTQRTAAEFPLVPAADPESVFSFRGQVLPAASLLNIVDVELIYDGVKYILKVKPLGFSQVSNTPEAGGLAGVFISAVSHARSGLAPGWVPGRPRQSRDLET